LAFVIYGSLVPFQYRPLAWEEAIAGYQQALVFHGFNSHSDLLANILLFIPLSYLLLAVISADRPRWVSWIAIPPVLIFCSLLSAAIEFAQVFFPPRCPDINDIIGESIGAGIGASVWLGFGRTITGWCRKVLSANRGQGSLLLAGYLVFLVLYQVLPLDLTLSPTEIVHKYRDGKIQIIPYTIPPGDRFEWFEKHCWTLALFFPVGMLWAGRPASPLGGGGRGEGAAATPTPHSHPLLPRGRGRTPVFGRCWPSVLGLGFLLAGLITFLKIFVVSRYVETGDIITGAIAIFLGWLAGSPLLSPSPFGEGGVGEGAATTLTPHPRPFSPKGRGGNRSVLFLAAIWLGIVIFVNWHPFDFETDSAKAVDRLENLSWLPFADYYQGSYINFLNQMVRKTLLFVPLGLLMASLNKSRERQRAEHWALQGRERKRPEFLSLLWVLLAALTVAGIVEIGLAFLPSRYPSVTDVLLETSGASIGFVLVRLGLSTSSRPNSASAQDSAPT
jgi:VanZ family protein